MNLMKLSTETKCQWIKLTWNLVNVARTFNANETYFMLCFVLFWLLWIGFETRAITIAAPSRSIPLSNGNRIVLFSYYIHKKQETNTSSVRYELEWVHSWTIYLSVGQWLQTIVNFQLQAMGLWPMLSKCYTAIHITYNFNESHL